jgi:hypothetical protein
VNGINALVAVMAAVSLLCQEANSGWVAISQPRREAMYPAFQERLRQLENNADSTATSKAGSG